MTPAARLQAAIEIIDRIRDGMAAERALTNWARASRFAGSKDRAAVRDHVFDCLRMWRSTAAQGGGETGRARILGLVRLQGGDEDELFSGIGHGPAPLSAAEKQAGQAASGAAAWDLPDWLAEAFSDGLGDQAAPTARALRSRADVFLRVNLLKTNVAAAQATLAAQGIATEPHALSPTALRVTEGARKIAQSDAFQSGLVELQDAASQAVVDALGLQRGAGLRVLDYCAGGGGKTLAMAAQLGAQIEAHDANPARLKDLPNRAQRAGAQVKQVQTPKSPYDLVLCDVPCSGSGAWRRSPEGKWRLTQEELQEVVAVQAEILDTCTDLVGAGGVLAYATCSVLPRENHQQVAQFLQRHPDWQLQTQRQFLPMEGGDGFFVTCLKRA